MDYKNQKVISIKGKEKNPYSQVIFIMKNNEQKLPVEDFVQEAEKIINGYISKKTEILNRKLNNAHIKEENGIKKLIIRTSKLEDIILSAVVLASSIGIILLLILLSVNLF